MYKECFMAAHPRAPVPINTANIDVSSLVFTNSILEFTATWDSPPIVYGKRIQQYEIHIGQNLLAPLDESKQNEDAFSKNVTTVRPIHRCRKNAFIFLCVYIAFLILFSRTTFLSVKQKYTRLIKLHLCIFR